MFGSRGCCSSLTLWLASHRQEQFEFRRQLILSVQSIREVDSSDSAVGVNLHPQRLYVVGTVGPTGEIRQVELNLVPALVQPHRHRTDEGLHPRRWLVVWCAESPPDTLVIQHLHLEGEVLLQVLNDHNQEWQLDGEGLLGVQRSVDVVGRDIGAHNLEHRRLDVGIGDSLDMTIPDALIPNLQRLRSMEIISG